MKLMAHPVHATPLSEPRPSVAYRLAEAAVLVAGLLTFGYLVLVWLPS